MKFSLIVSTLGRSDEVSILLQSLRNQTLKDFELIIVDQNDEEILAGVVKRFSACLPIKHVRTPGVRGLSVGRNEGVVYSTGTHLLFPDDDCWYPKHFLEDLKALFDETGAAIICGRAADPETGKSINGRFRTKPGLISRSNVWTSMIEWVTGFEKEAFLEVGGYNEKIGIGAATRWQSCEGQDIVLRALAHGFSAHYTPELFAHHAELDTQNPDGAMRLKGLKYARGMGRVLKIHNYTALVGVYWALRPLANAGLSLAKLNANRCAYFWNVFVGRLQGYFGSVQE